MPRNSSASRSADPHATAEIAVSAARLIADEGMDYAAAKRRAAREVLGDAANTRGLLPDNEQIEDELRRHLRLFGGPEQRTLLTALRRHALKLMQRLRRFEPRLVGAVLNGTATEFSDLQLHLYSDDVKEIEIQLLNERIDFAVDEGDPEPGGAIERIRFVTELTIDPGRRHRTGVVLALHPPVALRVAPRYRSNDAELHPVEASGRASIEQLETLLAADGAGS
ncbi:MAG TPA: UDP-N-acetylmuramate--alanine ligase [Burkholderiaceae bacterium]|nr:UDP-N-acetylmuramate--alanine ligase [Burkholderiaceae bacterium]